MKVALVTRPMAGGMRNHVIQLAGSLQANGVQFTLFGDNRTWHDYVPSGVEFQELQTSRAGGALSLIQNILRIRRYLVHNPMLVHSHGVSAAVAGNVAARWARCPALFTAHNIVNSSKFQQRVVVPFIGKSSNAIAVTSAVKQSLVGVGFHASNIQVIPNGIENMSSHDEPCADILQSHGLPVDRPVILAVGRLSKEKGFDLLIRCAAAVVQRIPEVVFAIAGDGPERDNLVNLRDKLGLRRFIVLLGHVKEPRRLMSCAEILVIPSRSEGQSLVALEAMDAKCPVIAFNTGGVSETLAGGTAGCLVEKESVKSLAEAIVRLHFDADARSLYVQVGREHVLRTGTAAGMCQSILNVYEQLYADMRNDQHATAR